MKRITYLILLIAALAGCATITSLDSTVELISEEPIDSASATPEPPPKEIIEKIVYVEKPIYIPTEPQEEVITDDSAVEKSMNESIAELYNWNGGITEYDYDPSLKFEIYTQVGVVTDIKLEPGEMVIGNPIIGDSTSRWVVGGSISMENGFDVQHINVKPRRSGLYTNMIINTDRRQYFLTLRSYSDKYMMMVKWNYPQFSLPLNFKRTNSNVSPLKSGHNIDIKKLSFNYSITHPEPAPSWIPEKVFDDGKKTYIRFPESILNMEMPGVFLGEEVVVNFHVDGNVIVIDRLIPPEDSILIKLNDSVITVRKGK